MALKVLRFREQNTVGRPLGAKNKRTLIREAEELIGVRPALDSLYVLEEAMAHFYTRAMNLKHAGGKAEIIDASFRDAVAIAEKIAPYRHARLSAIKLAGDPTNPLRVKGDATRDELMEEIRHHLGVLIDSGVLDLEALMASRRSVN